MSLSPAELATLDANRTRFAEFLDRRVADPNTAYEILENVYARARRRIETPTGDQCAVRWFYGLLRQALADHYRQQAAEARATVRKVRGRAIAAARPPKAERRAQIDADLPVGPTLVDGPATSIG